MKRLLILLITMFAATGLAQSLGNGPVKINSDSMKYFGSEYKSTFSGNVIASSDTFNLTADVVDVYFNEKNEVLRIVCKGRVNFKTTKDNILAVANNAELVQPTKTITLEGKAEIWQKENYLQGEKIRLQYETKEIHVDKGSGDRVTVIFKPDDNTSLP